MDWFDLYEEGKLELPEVDILSNFEVWKLREQK